MACRARERNSRMGSHGQRNSTGSCYILTIQLVHEYCLAFGLPMKTMPGFTYIHFHAAPLFCRHHGHVTDGFDPVATVPHEALAPVDSRSGTPLCSAYQVCHFSRSAVMKHQPQCHQLGEDQQMSEITCISM